jgi:hypothetical protein
MSYCSPNVNVTGIGNHYTCFDHDELKEIALALNIYIQKNKLCLLESSNKLKSKTCSILVKKQKNNYGILFTTDLKKFVHMNIVG